MVGGTLYAEKPGAYFTGLLGTVILFAIYFTAPSARIFSISAWE